MLRASYREQGKVKTRTLAKLSPLPNEAIETLRRSLKGEKLVSVEEVFEIITSRHQGHIDAVYTAIKRLGIETLIASRPSNERNLVLALLIARLVQPTRKLATPRGWRTTTLPDLLGVTHADEDDLYSAMDWLLERQTAIENKIAARHLQEGELVFYDLSSRYFEGVTCPLARFGYNRDGKKGKLQVNYGLLTDSRGCPVSVFEGNTTEGKTLMPQVDMMQQRFKIKTLTLVGDRGMITQKHIDEQLRDRAGVDWITALKNTSIQKLVKSEKVQFDLFDENKLFELTHADYPGERLIACRNVALAGRSNKKRNALLKATEQLLEKHRNTIHQGKLSGKEKIRARVNKGVGNALLAYFAFEISDDHLQVDIVHKQSLLDEIYSNLCKKLEKISTRVRQGKLKGKTKIRTRVKKLLNKTLMTLIKLDVGDDHFSFSVNDETRVKQAALAHLNHPLNHVVTRVQQGRYGGKDKIGLRVAKVINQYKMAKHFNLTFTDDDFTFQRDADKVAAEAVLDGIVIIRTRVSAEQLTAHDTVRSDKSWSQVERAFRSFNMPCLINYSRYKSLDLQVRPLHHRLENRVRGHIFLCMLAYYVEWHMKEAWRPLLFSDEDQEAKSRCASYPFKERTTQSGHKNAG